MANNSHAGGRDMVPPSGSFDTVGSIATNVAEGFTMVAVGDLIVTRALTKGQDPDFGAVLKILREADVTFGNMETSLFGVLRSSAIEPSTFTVG
ncbi:hypothetical protein [Sinorhizobium numidicum]|uniref:hypothetical protein n=1 Tax=Sinorhizobium numidicum TaxID=680248 RepID=UPI003144DEEA